MKRNIPFLLLALLLALTACGTDLPAEGTAELPLSSETVEEIRPAGTAEELPTPEPGAVTVTDIEYHEGVLCALERFWSDAYYDYYFPYTETVAIVHYSDGTQQSLQEALEENRVTVEDMDRFGVFYYRYFVVRVADIVDRTQTEPLTTADALEGFWSDGEYDYYFGSIKSHYVIVHYNNGCQEPVRDALKGGRVTIEDLDRFGIDYWKEPAITVTDIDFVPGMDTALELFFSDKHYDYYFPCMGNTGTVYFSDGTTMTLEDALRWGNIMPVDFDRFGIDYIRQMKINAVYIRADAIADGGEDAVRDFAGERSEIPASVLFDEDALSEFLQKAGQYYELTQSTDGSLSFLEQAGQYDWLWFREHGLLVLSVSGDGGIRHQVVSQTFTAGSESYNGTFSVQVKRLFPEEPTNELSHWFILLELPQEALSGWVRIDARYIN